jgi:hypothetical protein
VAGSRSDKASGLGFQACRLPRHLENGERRSARAPSIVPRLRDNTARPFRCPRSPSLSLPVTSPSNFAKFFCEIPRFTTGPINRWPERTVGTGYGKEGRTSKPTWIRSISCPGGSATVVPGPGAVGRVHTNKTCWGASDGWRTTRRPGVSVFLPCAAGEALEAGDDAAFGGGDGPCGLCGSTRTGQVAQFSTQSEHRGPVRRPPH